MACLNLLSCASVGVWVCVDGCVWVCVILCVGARTFDKTSN